MKELITDKTLIMMLKPCQKIVTQQNKNGQSQAVQTFADVLVGSI